MYHDVRTKKKHLKHAQFFACTVGFVLLLYMCSNIFAVAMAVGFGCTGHFAANEVFRKFKPSTLIILYLFTLNPSNQSHSKINYAN